MEVVVTTLQIRLWEKSPDHWQRVPSVMEYSLSIFVKAKTPAAGRARSLERLVVVAQICEVELFLVAASTRRGLLLPCPPIFSTPIESTNSPAHNSLASFDLFSTLLQSLRTSSCTSLSHFDLGHDNQKIKKKVRNLD